MSHPGPAPVPRPPDRDRSPARATVQAPPAPAVTVHVTFFADLRRFLPRGADGPQAYALREGARVEDLLALIGIDPEAEVTAAVNGELAGGDTPLADGAEIMLLSPMEGGRGTLRAAGETR